MTISTLARLGLPTATVPAAHSQPVALTVARTGSITSGFPVRQVMSKDFVIIFVNLLSYCRCITFAIFIFLSCNEKNTEKNSLK